MMVAYAYDTIARGNPVGFLGMVHVLEGPASTWPPMLRGAANVARTCQAVRSSI